MPSIEAPVADWVTIPDLYRDPFPIYERLRAEGGVHWVPAVGRYLVTSYQAVHETELDQEVFSANEQGSLQIRAMGHSMLRRDDPEHYLERKAWQPVLRPGVVKRTWTEVFERNAARYLDEFVAKGPGADLVWDFAAPYAAENLREIIGLHNATQEDLQRWSQTMIDATGNYADDPDVWAAGERSFDEVDIALDEMLRWHQGHPDHSLLSSLLRIPDYEMPIERIRANVKMTIGGGLNEPRDALGVAAWALLDHPEQRAAAEADPALWQSVFDEAIRWIAPIGLYSRQVTRDTVLAGVRLPAGAKLGICILSANRDTNVWPDAERFDIHREVKPHLAFGKGVHVCLGAWVARAEVADVALPMLFRRLDGLSLSASAPPRSAGWVFRGMTKLPVEWTRCATPRRRSSRRRERMPRPAWPSSARAPPAASPRRRCAGRSRSAPIDVFDELPTPYGLVRYGVAADHQGTKSIARQFDRLFTHEGVRFRGNTRIGADVSLDELRRRIRRRRARDGHARRHPTRRFPAATFRTCTAPAASPGSSTPTPTRPTRPASAPTSSSSARETSRWTSRASSRAQRRACDGTDVADDRARAGSPATCARSTSSGGARRTRRSSTPSWCASSPDSPASVMSSTASRRFPTTARMPASTRCAHSRPPTPASSACEWNGGSVSPPGASRGTDAGSAVTFVGVDGEVVLRADDVITAVGFAPTRIASRSRARRPTAGSRRGSMSPAGCAAVRAARFPTSASTRARSHARSPRTSRQAPSGLRPRDGRTVRDEIDFDGWRRIDLRERLGAAPGRERAKLPTRDAQLEAAGDLDLVLPDADRDGTTSLGEGRDRSRSCSARSRAARSSSRKSSGGRWARAPISRSRTSPMRARPLSTARERTSSCARHTATGRFRPPPDRSMTRSRRCVRTSRA